MLVQQSNNFVNIICACPPFKTILVNEKLAQLSDNYMVANVPFNYYTTSEMLQKILEKPLEKKAGKNYGPPGNKKVIKVHKSPQIIHISSNFIQDT